MSVQQTSNGGYIVTGRTDNGSGLSDVYLIKTSSSGNEEWSQTFGGEETDYGRSVQQTSDGGYIITGYTNSFGNGESDVYLLKTSENGDLEWEKTFGGTNIDYGRSVQQTNDGGYIIIGSTFSFGNYIQVYLIKTDLNGDEEWFQIFGGTNIDQGYSIQQTIDGGYILSLIHI